MSHWFITQLRIVKAGLVSFIRNATLAVAAIAVMVITLTIVLTSVIANATFSNTIQQINSQIDISVYLKDSVTPAQEATLLQQIQALSNVKSATYISKEQALTLYEQQNADNATLLQAIS